MYANVIVEIGVKNVDRMFTYIVPDNIKDDIRIGARVKVPFANKTLEGFVLELKDSYDGEYELKEIISLVDLEPILNKEMLYLGKKIQEHTLCSLISAYQVMLPKALKAKNDVDIKIKEDRYLILNKKEDEIKEYISKCRYPKQIDLLNKLLIEKKIKISKLDSSINTLINHELVKFIYEESYRYNIESNHKYKNIELTHEQQEVVDSVKLGEANTYLLYGVTGSGKTEVYMNIIDKVLKMGCTAIMLVPEISLTPQIVDRFLFHFKENIAILHSGLSDTEKYDEYRKIASGKTNIVIGARSAIFAPLKNLGVIIIDEEHTSTYKQDNHPRYHARDVAIERSKYHNCPLVLGSATPSMESMARSANGVYKLLTLTKRVGNSHLPSVNIVNMQDEVKKGNMIFSNLLKNKIQDRLNKHEQIILLLNRRGYSSVISCRDCGSVYKCPNCDITLTYHKTSNTFRCHYCNYTKKNNGLCPECGSKNIGLYGLGTEKLEEEINKKFPNARVVRMDVDTTSRKGMHEKIINDFGDYKYDILLGTQMIAKGLDFPLVSLVGVINADSSLNIPDFRSSERTFQLLSQVSGRAGRSDIPGEVIIQTYNSNHYSINYAKCHDYLGFYREEMKLRKELKYSPYYYIILVNINSKDYEYGFREANKIGDYLRNNLNKNTIILGPSMANIFKVNNIYHYQCIIKYQKDDKLYEILKFIDEKYKMDNKVNVEIDVDPSRM